MNRKLTITLLALAVCASPSLAMAGGGNTVQLERLADISGLSNGRWPSRGDAGAAATVHLSGAGGCRPRGHAPKPTGCKP